MRITERELTPNTVVMVPVGWPAGASIGDPCVVAWAVVRGPASKEHTYAFIDSATRWWLDVYLVPGGEPMQQMYRADEILGVPALGLHMDGAPAR